MIERYCTDKMGLVPVINRYGEADTITQEFLLDAPSVAWFAKRLKH